MRNWERPRLETNKKDHYQEVETIMNLKPRFLLVKNENVFVRELEYKKESDY